MKKNSFEINFSQPKAKKSQTNKAVNTTVQTPSKISISTASQKLQTKISICKNILHKK